MRGSMFELTHNLFKHIGLCRNDTNYFTARNFFGIILI